MKQTNYYHAFNKGENVIFRDVDDFITFNNKLAIAAYHANIGILAFAIMSTHFHAIIEAIDESAIDKFLELLSKVYSIHYGRKYGPASKKLFRMSTVVVEPSSLETEMLYVLKNPVHHYVDYTPLSYEFCSAAYMFMDELLPKSRLDAIESGFRKVKDLGVRQYRTIIGREHVPEDWQVDNDGMILPGCFIRLSKAKAIWSGNVKTFLYAILKTQTDVNKEVIKDDILELRTNGFSDMYVCRIADGFITDRRLRSIHQLSEPLRDEIWKILEKRGIQPDQARRVLWLNG